MQFNTGMQPDNFMDMCAYCEMSTGGQHQSHCPFYLEPYQFHLTTPKGTVRIFRILDDGTKIEL